jgi:hypothetical protein
LAIAVRTPAGTIKSWQKASCRAGAKLQQVIEIMMKIGNIRFSVMPILSAFPLIKA